MGHASYASPGDLVSSMAKANRVDSTHLRALLAHVPGGSSQLETFLHHKVLEAEPLGIDIGSASTVEAFLCDFEGLTFMAFTMPMRAGGGRTFPNKVSLMPVKPAAKARKELLKRHVDGAMELAVLDMGQPPPPVFDATTVDEYLIQVPPIDRALEGPTTRISFLDCAQMVAELAEDDDHPLSFLHAPAALPGLKEKTRQVVGPCLRFGVAIPTNDIRARLKFGADLVRECIERGYHLWEREAHDPENVFDYWQEVVSVEPDASRKGARFELKGNQRLLAITCVGPAQRGTTAATLRVLRQKGNGAPLGAIAATTLDDIAIINLLTRATPKGVTTPDPALSADAALAQVLGLRDRKTEKALADYRAVTSWHSPTTAAEPDDEHALWLGWEAPATSTALSLTLETARGALALVLRQYGSDATPDVVYTICREVSVDRLRGRMKVALDFSQLASRIDRTENPFETVLGRFCSDVERHWRAELSFALGTPRIDLDVTWRESWMGRWTSIHRATSR